MLPFIAHPGRATIDPATRVTGPRIVSAMHPRSFALAAATLLRVNSPAAIADAFIATRIAGAPRQLYGQGLEATDVRGMLDRVLPP